jgi:type I restriction enzyme M protein
VVILKSCIRYESINTLKWISKQYQGPNFHLDLKNPRNSDTSPGDVNHLLPEYEKLLAPVAGAWNALKAHLLEALSR